LLAIKGDIFFFILSKGMLDTLCLSLATFFSTNLSFHILFSSVSRVHSITGGIMMNRKQL